MDKQENISAVHRPVRAEKARLFAPSRSIRSEFEPCACFETGLPPLLSTNGSVSIWLASRSYPELTLT
jgi:hypothetical protein